MLLFALLSVFVYKYYDIIKFFNNYVRSGYKTTVVTDLEKIYTPFSLFLCVFAIIFLSIIIVVLLNHKKKPYGLYASLIIYYVIALIALFYLASVFKGFEMELLASTVSRGIRDIIIIYFLPQFVFLCLILVRVVGFNIRKFDFTDARNEFVGDANDAEEVEINFKIDGHKLKQTFNRATREGVYYLKENKFIVVCILIALGITSVFLIYKNTHNNYDRYYSMARVFVYKDLNISVEDAIVTNLDFNGNVIKENKYYVVLKMHVANDTGDNKTLDYNHFKLIIDGKNINPIVSYAKYFADFASGEVISSYSPKAERTFALVYEIDAKQARKNAKLNIFTGSVYEKGVLKELFGN